MSIVATRFKLPVGIEPRALSFYLSTIFVGLGVGIVAPVLPEIREDFGVSYGQVGFMVSAFSLASLLVDVPVGLIADKFNRNHLIMLGSLLVALGSIAAGSSGAFEVLVASRVLMGAGSSLCATTCIIALSSIAGVHNRGRVLALLSATNLSAATLSPAIGGFIDSLFGWRTAFYFCGITALVAILAVFLSQSSGCADSAEAASALDERPVARAAITREKNGFSIALLCAFIATFVMYFSRASFAQALVPFFGSAVLHLDSAVIGLVLAMSSLIMALAMFPTGTLSDRYGRKFVFTPGALLMAVGVLYLLFVNDLTQFVVAAIVVSVGGLSQIVPVTMVGDLSGPREMSRNIGIFRLIADMGYFVGPFALSTLLDFFGFGVPIILFASMAIGVTVLVNLLIKKA